MKYNNSGALLDLSVEFPVLFDNYTRAIYNKC